MAKPAASVAYRKIDVDKFGDDNYNEEDAQQSDEVQGPDEGEVNALLTQKKNSDALKLVLANAPVTARTQAIKDKALQLTLRVLSAFPKAEIERAVKGLEQPMVDVLMKYIYRGFETPTEGTSAILLTWHEKTFAVGGQGCIVRVLTDRKRV